MPTHETLQLVRRDPAKHSALARFFQSVRSSWSGPLSAKSPELARLWGGTSSSTGIAVSEQTALTYSAVWAAVNLISGDIAALPLVLYKRRQDGGKEKFTSHKLYRLLHDSPNPEMPSLVFRRTLQAHALTWGNGYAEIERDGAGRPVAIWPMLPHTVAVVREGDRLLYRQTPPQGGRPIDFAPRDVIHIQGLGLTGAGGLSVVAQARESIGLGLAEERFGGTFFGNGSTFGGALQTEKVLTETAQANLKKSIEARHKGVDRAHQLLILEEGLKYVPLGIPPNDAQFLESRQFQVLEIARWFNLPPHKLAHMMDATFSNVEQQNLDYYTSCLRPWLEMWEQELKRKLVSPLEYDTQDVGHITEDFLRADSAGRAALETSHFNIGGVTPNEIRLAENRNPIAGGDTAFVQLNLIPLSKSEAWWDAQIAEKQAQIEKLKQPPPPPVPAAGSEETKAARAALVAQLDHANGLLVEARADVLKAQDALALALSEAVTERTAHAATREQAAALSAEAARQADAATAAQLRGDELDARCTVVATELGTLTVAAQQLTRDVEALSQRNTEASATITTLQADLDQARTTVGALEAERDRLQGDVDRQAALVTTAAADLEAATAQRDEAQAATQRLEAQVAELGEASRTAATVAAADLAAAIAGRDAANAIAEARGEAHTQEVADHHETRTALAAREARIAEIEAQRHVDATVAAADLAAALTERDEAMSVRDAAVVQQRAAEGLQMVADGARVAAEQRAEQAERDRDIAVQAQTAANATVEAQRTAEAALKTALITAQRGLLVDAVGRLVRREIDRARQHQATPEKLRKWIGYFYDSYLEACRDALIPAMRAHMALIGSEDDPVQAAEMIATAHVDESKRQLLAVADADDRDFHDALTRMLSRWESHRANTVADAIQASEIAHVRTV